MSSVKEKRFRKLKRKKIWPSIVAFILFTLLCVGMIVLFLQLFALYIMGTKIVQQYGEMKNVKAVIKVARTIADLEGEDQIREEHLSEAVFYRSMTEKYWGVAEL